MHDLSLIGGTAHNKLELQKSKQMIAIKNDTCGCWDGGQCPAHKLEDLQNKFRI